MQILSVETNLSYKGRTWSIYLERYSALKDSDYKHLKTSLLKRMWSCKEAIKRSVRGFIFSIQLMPGAGLLLPPQENRNHWNGNTDVMYHYISIFRSPCWEEFNKLKPKLISCEFLPQTAGAGSQLLTLQTSGYCLSGTSSAAGWFHFGSHILFCTVLTRLFLCQANAHLWRLEPVCMSSWDSAACPCQLKQQQQKINIHFDFEVSPKLKTGAKEGS